MEVKNLMPAAIWENFAALNAVPRASKKEERVIAFMQAFGEQLGLDTRTDAVGNVVIKKPASPGMEDRQTVILQSHLDMVHQKNGDTSFDFSTQGIAMFVDGDWVRARGTTLGADNGIGVAAIMGILAAADLAHPALEAMFTIDEETGMTGAKELEGSNFSGTLLLNLDTEEDDELTIGCAGGIDTNTSFSYQEENTAADSLAVSITIKGLLGGHSGMDIHKGRANANKLMNRLCYSLLADVQLQLHSIDGGSLRNAIPRESRATVVFPADRRDIFFSRAEALIQTIKTEYELIEPGMHILLEETGLPEKVMPAAVFRKLVNTLYALPNGVYRMSPDVPGLVETSSNLARVKVSAGTFSTQSLQRSSVESTKTDIANAVRAAFENMGCDVQQEGDYPGWKPNADSALLKLMTGLFRETFGTAPKVAACHAGLECGILGAHLPGVDMISFGPTIHGAHSPDECVQISSVQKFWNLLTAVLKEIPKTAK